MTTATYTHTHSSSDGGPSRWMLPAASLVLGGAAVVLSVVALATDDVAETPDSAIVVETPIPQAEVPVVGDAPVVRRAVADDPGTCGVHRVGTGDYC